MSPRVVAATRARSHIQRRGKCHVLPHRGVLRPAATPGKGRVTLVRRIPGAVGRWCIGGVAEVGRASPFLLRALGSAARPPFRPGEVVLQLRFIGNHSVLLVLLASSFTGMVLALQGYIALSRFGSTSYLGPLVALYDPAGMAAGYLLSVGTLRVDGGVFISSIRESVGWVDVAAGLWKSLVFAILIVWIAAYRGYLTAQGALGVGRATTRAVVTTTALILAADYVMTALLF
jgi:ABC-type transporter Mla maintaining outer membrane lipid asymmetry permease subunit MlaE